MKLHGHSEDVYSNSDDGFMQTSVGEPVSALLPDTKNQHMMISSFIDLNKQ